MTAALPPVVVSPEVSDALASGAGVVALESTIISHGLPTESAATTAKEIEAAVRRGGAVPATIALVDGAVRVGLDDEALTRVAEDEGVVKASLRDLGQVIGRRLTGATTVAATSHLAHLAGIGVFATGGLGGVHRGADESYDESADLLALATIPITIVCAGVKSILDVPATLERLETLSVVVLGYGTDRFPGFYIRDTGLEVPWRCDEPAEIAQLARDRRALGLDQAIVVANPIAAAEAMPLPLHDQLLAGGLAAAEAAGVRGKDVTPFLLAYFHEQSGGLSLKANVALVLANAELAGRIAGSTPADR
ncbi:MAG: pseudouridine-5'-phosphate glycosidase [Nocardioidaceae bacterium]